MTKGVLSQLRAQLAQRAGYSSVGPRIEGVIRRQTADGTTAIINNVHASVIPQDAPAFEVGDRVVTPKSYRRRDEQG